MKFGPPIVLFVVLASIWMWLHLENTARQIELTARQESTRDLTSAMAENYRLRKLQPTPEEWTALQRDHREVARLHQEIKARTGGAPGDQPSAFTSGDWTPSTQWSNRGNATPAQSIETLLWAAAGGDTAEVQKLLHLDPVTRTAAEALFAQLPAATSAFNGSLENFVATFTSKAIPLGDAQLLWHQQSSDHEATVCLFLRHRDWPEKPGATVSPDDRPPPTLAEDRTTRMRFLALRRHGDSWQVVVPLAAIEKMAAELTGPK